MPLYADASALVKLVVDEPETEALRVLVARHDLVSTVLAEVEVRLATARRRAGVDRIGALLDRVSLVDLTPAVVARAGRLEGLRAIDAVHLATALEAGGVVDAFVAYDRRLLDAARAAGFAVLSPGA